MAQFARPNADDATGSWAGSGGGSLYVDIDESSAVDTDYIFSYQPFPPDVCQISLSSVTDPAVGTGHIGRVRCRVVNMVMDSPQFSVDLAEAGVVVSNLYNGPINWGSWTTLSQTFGSGEIDTITDYTDLSYQISADGYMLDAGLQVEVSWAELEVPDAAASGRKIHPLAGPTRGLIS